MDRNLPEGATVTVRAPQIVGELRHRFYNLKEGGQDAVRSWMNAVFREMGDGIHIREDEAYLFGTNNEFNEIGTDPLQDRTYFEKDKRDRLAFWGVNRLKDMSNLNTDLFSTMSNYACMSSMYGAMSSVVDIAELGKQVLAARTLRNPGDNEDKQVSGKNTRCYARYLKMLEKQVYGLDVTPPRFQEARIGLKLIRNLTALGSRIALSFSGFGGLVNANTGLIEVLKEAFTGEFYTKEELWDSIKFFYRFIISNWRSKGGHQRKMDQISLLVRHFDMLGRNKDFLKGQRYDRGLFGMGPNLKSWLKSIAMAPYQLGEFFMNVFPFIAILRHEKYWIEASDGKGGKTLKPISMLDLYDYHDEIEVEDYSTAESKKVKKQIDRVSLKKGMVAFLSRKDYNNYNLINKIL